MAPATRSRQAAGVKKAPPARKSRATRSTKNTSEDWTMQDNQDIERPQEMDENDQHVRQDYNGSLAVASREPTELNLEEDEPMGTMQQMREMAERVGKEAETFAQNLDTLLGELATRNKYEAVLDAVKSFKETAQRAALTLEKKHERERAQQLRKEWSEQADIPSQTLRFDTSTQNHTGRSISDATSGQIQKLRQWQQEADLWELFRMLLELHHNPDDHAQQQQKEQTLHRLGQVHRYTSEEDLWTRFLIEDDVAQERAMIKKWLEETADHQESDIPNIMEELEVKAGRGKGLWSDGWLHTREKIKAEKRLRSWPNTAGAPLPHIKRSDNNEVLVTSLDPDATSRQERTLEKPDVYFERAMWIACWEMLRRGKSWEEVSGWCRRHHESWRAISMGKATNPEAVRSKAAWRNVCYLASQAGASSEYEAAVYGLLGGSVNAVQKVCRTVDDILYAHYSAALIQQFDLYLASHYPDRALQNRRGRGEDAFRNSTQQIVDLVLRLRKQPTTRNEAILPMKIIQSYMLANDLGSMVHTLGYAIAYIDKENRNATKAVNEEKDEEVIVPLDPFWPGEGNLPEGEIAMDHQTLRIAALISILLRCLSDEIIQGHDLDAEENVIMAYIQSLRSAGKYDLIPMYASRLSVGRYVVCLSRILEDIDEPSDQQTILKLLTGYGMDNVMILNESLFWLLSKYIAPSLRERNTFKFLEKTDDTRLYPGQRIIAGALPKHPIVGDSSIVNALQWYNMVEGQWNDTFEALATALRKCLAAGRIFCAMRIVSEYPFENLSLRKSHHVLGKSVNMMEYDGPAPANERTKWEMLRRYCRSYYELEQIVNAIKALCDWRELEADYTSGKYLRMSAPPEDLKKAKEVVDYTMAQVLEGNILQQPITTDEAADFAYIRVAYIPELIIAYNSVLHTAGSLISRDNLIESMDLSVTVAKEDNALAECITKAGRMRELLKSFAQTSKLMLVLKAAKGWKPKKDREGKDLGIWEIGPQGTGNVEGLDEEVSL